MSNVISKQELENYREESSGDVRLSDGSMRSVRMTERLWNGLELIQVLEGLSQEDLSDFALEEMEINPDVTFNRAFRGIIASITNAWHDN
jgi:hypothetical protein